MHAMESALPALPIKSRVSDIVGFLRRFNQHVRPNFILGLSGGVDSATVAYLLVEAVGKNKIKAMIMPYHQSDKEIIEDTLLIVNALDISYQVIDISYCMENAYFKQFPGNERMRVGNKLARERMAILYDIAALFNGLVVGTGNRSELLLGYFTKYGDGGVDLEPLGGLYKTYVYQLAKYLGVPDNIIQKTPTADFWPGQKDEEEMGIEYRIADQLLYFLVDRGEDVEGVIQYGFKREDILRVVQMMSASSHKRLPPPIPVFKDQAKYSIPST